MFDDMLDIVLNFWCNMRWSICGFFVILGSLRGESVELWV